MYYVLLCLVLNSFLIQINAENNRLNDEIHDLPGLGSKPNFRQYSGYLNASEDRKLHYWFVESQSYPKTDPVILWLNGGPGCSSLEGFFTENGPFRVSEDGKNLTFDQFSWNTVANVIYLETPAGVGYSYREINSENLVTNDDQTARNNYLALLHFFEKFPQFKVNDFYITGESYAGVYIPFLALEILRDNSKIKLKGVAIGNGYFDSNILQNTQFQMAFNHGLIDTETWNSLTDNCCSCNGHKQVCDFMGASQFCNELAESAYYNATYYSGINPYNIYDECHYTDVEKSSSYSRFLIDMALHSNDYKLKYFKNFPQNQYFEGKECFESSFFDYLNDPNVRKAIHVPENLSEFKLCNNFLSEVYERTNNMRKEFVELLLKYKLDPFIVYNGDADLVCDFISNQIFLDGLNLPVIQKYKTWTFDGLTVGFFKRYRGLTFVTFKGAGHMVPSNKPGPALHLIKTMIGKAKLH
jgi:cathepsin A (carboxypeptidase C)